MWNDFVAHDEDFIIRRPSPGDLYQHFKGGIYQVICVGRDEADSSRELVVYRSIVDHKTWIRELGSFMSKVDGDKYPDHAGEDRLTWVGSISG